MQCNPKMAQTFCEVWALLHALWVTW